MAKTRDKNVKDGRMTLYVSYFPVARAAKVKRGNEHKFLLDSTEASRVFRLYSDKSRKVFPSLAECPSYLELFLEMVQILRICIEGIRRISPRTTDQ
jgi:hypothetical protein